METLNEIIQPQQNSLYKIRDVGATLNETFSYYFKNFGNLFLPLLLIVWPVRVVMTFIMKNEIQDATARRLGGTSQNTFSYLMGILFFSFSIQIFSSIGNSIIILYMQAKDTEKAAPLMGEVFYSFAMKLPKIFIVGLITGIMIMVGTLFIFIPGIYLAVVFSVVFPVVVIEKRNIFDSIGRCFGLVNDRFWSTFGLIIVMCFIIIILNLLGEIPTLVVTFTERLSGFGSEYYNPDPYAARHLIPLLIEQLVITLSYGILTVALTLWYYSLVEHKDGITASIMLDSIKDKQVTGNEGEF